MTELLVNTKTGKEWVLKEGPETQHKEFQVKPWGYDQWMLLYGYDTANLGELASNFQVVAVFIEDEMGYGHAKPNMQSIVLPRDIIFKVAGMQILDDDFTLSQKMNWYMSGLHGRPCWFDNPDWNWNTAPYAMAGMMIFGGNVIRSAGEKEIFGNYRGFVGRYDCIEIETIPKNAIGFYTYQSHPHLVHRCTAAMRKDGQENIFYEPRGGIHVPVYRLEEYMFRGFAGFHPNRYYLPKEVLIPL